jgi:bifunctional non-homologous end joining protein LigD
VLPALRRPTCVWKDVGVSAEQIDVGGRQVALSNLDKVLYPDVGFTKGQVVEYYTDIAPVALPHLAGRCITLRRFPNGTDQPGFFEKRCPKHRPDWVSTAIGAGDGKSGPVAYCLFDEPAALVWSANLAALELHAPMALAGDLETPRALVFDFDPGAPAGMRECCAVALLVRSVLDGFGLEGWCKTSGSKGLQLYVPLNSAATHEHTSQFALAVGQLLERDHPELVITTMARAVRPGKVFIDWSQNARHKTTIAVYSLRARPEPTVSTPVTWDEVEASAAGEAELRFLPPAVLARLDALGDLFSPVLTLTQQLPASR